MTTSTCPNPSCRRAVSGVAHRYHCQDCDCLFSENPEDRGVPPILAHTWKSKKSKKQRRR